MRECTSPAPTFIIRQRAEEGQPDAMEKDFHLKISLCSEKKAHKLQRG